MAVTYSPVEDAYKKQKKAIAQVAAAEQAAVEAQKEDIQDNAISAVQQAYIQQQRARAQLKQHNKAAGITGGAAESSDIALQANYNTNRTNAQIARDQQIAELEIGQKKTEAQAMADQASVDVQMQTGKLAFSQEEQTQRRSELWALVKGGIINQQIANELGYNIQDLQNYYNNHKEN